jgi:hypothetical protein
MTKKLDLETIKMEARKLGYDVLSKEYENNWSKIEFIHISCKRKFVSEWSRFQQGVSRCSLCNKKERYKKNNRLESCKIEAFKRGYEILDSEYNGSNYKMKFFHSECKKEFFITWHSFHHGSGCKTCAMKKNGKNKRLKIEDCILIAKRRGFILLEEEYIGIKTKMLFKHLKCGNEFFTHWGSFGRGTGCPKCGGTQKLTLEECSENAKAKGFLILSKKYKNVSSRLLFLHEKCNKKFYLAWTPFKDGQGCPHCSNRKNITINYCYRISKKRGYILLSKKYIKSSEKLYFKHLKCGRKFYTSWNSFSNLNTGCPSCGGSEKLTIKYCLKRSKKRKYLLLSKKYKNCFTKMTFKHIKCGNKFKMTWANFGKGVGCPICASEQKESNIAYSLKKYLKNKYNSKSEYKKLRNPRTGWFLPYDIYIPKWKIFIEVQGQQHFEYRKSWHKTIENFKYSQYKDKIKKRFAKNNGIFLEIDIRKVKTIKEAKYMVEKIIDKQKKENAT